MKIGLRRFRPLLVIGFVCLSVLGITACRNTDVYSNPALGLQFETPVDWQIEQHDGFLRLLPPQEESPPTDYRPSVLIIDVKDPQENALRLLENFMRAPFGRTNREQYDVLEPPARQPSSHQQMAMGLVDVNMAAERQVGDDNPYSFEISDLNLAPWMRHQIIVVREGNRAVFIIGSWPTIGDSDAAEVVAIDIANTLTFLSPGS